MQRHITAIRKPHPYSLAIYLLLANGITWLGWIPGLVIGARHGHIMPNFTNYADLFATGFANRQHLWLGIAFSMGVYGPLIGALVATWMDDGRAGVADLWQRIIHWQVRWQWYLIALTITLLLTAAPVLIFAATGASTLQASSTMTPRYLLFLFVIQLFTSGLGEEPGWRGYLLPRLQAKWRDEKAIWVLGIIWAIWHYPLVIFQLLPTVQNTSMMQLVITILVSLTGQTMALVGLSFIYVWLYNRTRSLFLAIVFHALSNLFSVWLLSYLTEPQAAVLLAALMPWLLVFVLKRWLGKERFPVTSVAMRRLGPS